ncbi:MAG: SAM-dependent methyltransferase [Xanthomonadales bacterium]|nr:SAM-dependent methyltransferase [Xanthomonadales bacterium]
MESDQLHFPAACSRTVQSKQTAPHSRLGQLVDKHMQRPWKAPLHRPSARACDQAFGLAARISNVHGLVFDSGCGTGESTRSLAKRWPDHVVFGVDRSAHRLSRTGHARFPVMERNIVWLRSELTTFWRLALGADLHPDRHYLLYPNPSPKPAQVRRRWHAHPVFPVLVALGGVIELRSNWNVYVEEFARAIEQACGSKPEVRTLEPAVPFTRFEQKYQASGHTLYRLMVDLRQGGLAGAE